MSNLSIELGSQHVSWRWFFSLIPVFGALGIPLDTSVLAATSGAEIDDRVTLTQYSEGVNLNLCDTTDCTVPTELAQLPSLPAPPPNSMGIPSLPSPPNGIPTAPVPIYVPSYGAYPYGVAPSYPNGISPTTMPSYGAYPYGQVPYGSIPVNVPSSGAYPYGQPPANTPPSGTYPYGQPPANAVPGVVIYPVSAGAPGYPYIAPLPPLPAPPAPIVPPGSASPGIGVPPAAAYPYGVVILMPPPGYGYSPAPLPSGSAAYMMALPVGAYPYNVAAPVPGYPYPPNTTATVGYPAGPVMPSNVAIPTAIAPSVQAYPVPQAYPATALQPQPGLDQPAPGRPAPNANPEPTNNRPLLRSTALNQPTLRFQGAYLLQGDESSGRARVTGVYPLTPNLLAAGTIDFTTGRAFTDSQEGVSINELFLAASIPDLPNLRFAVGQLDLTSYFDRNSFAKDGASQFFNPVFQTSPALAAAGISSRQGALLNWSITDNAEFKAAVFSSARNISDFSLDGFAGELGIRSGNFIIRATYASSRDIDSRTGFREIFQIDRGQGQFGLLKGDREEAYGLNVEAYFPEIRMGVFGRYGRYNNLAINQSGDTFNVGLTFLDLLTQNDRLGIAYGRDLSNAQLRQQSGITVPDVAEIFYDFPLLPNLRLGFSTQARDAFSETILGIRIKTEFDLVPPRSAP